VCRLFADPQAEQRNPSADRTEKEDEYEEIEGIERPTREGGEGVAALAGG
jgi:hypothetical protein